MAQGSPIVKFRISALYLAAIERAIASANRSRKKEPYDMSSWLRDAVMEKLGKSDRSRKSRLKKRAAAASAKIVADV